MMNKTLLAAVAAASLMAFGCDDKNANKAATPETNSAANKVSDKAVDVTQGIEKSVKGGADEAKDMADKKASDGSMTKDAANAVKTGAETVQNNILDLTGKAKQAIQDKKFDEAQGFVQQLKDLKGKLPADAQTQVDQQLAELDKMIAAGKALMMPAGK